MAIAEAMREEYRAIVQAGFLLQVDSPDLAAPRTMRFWDLSLPAYRKQIAQNVEALNAALADIPPDKVRLHICWGNYEGPHHADVAVKDIIDILLQARTQALSIEAANPRHGHEWRVWEHVKLPEGKILIPGVIDDKTSFIEHPELVAERIMNYAKLVGQENVIAGVDCGFGTGATLTPRCHPTVAWAKLKALAEGAALATKQLWRR